MHIKFWYILFPAGLCLLSFPACAQTKNISDTLMPHRVLIIPFEPKMLMSEIDKDVNAQTKLNYTSITKAFRAELNLAMVGMVRRCCTAAISLLNGKPSSDSTLSYIYGSTAYSYDLVPGATPDATPNKDNSKYIQNGELQVPLDYSKRFMNISILNPKLLTDLNAEYNTDTYIFINELDIKNVDNSSVDLSDDPYRREITVQYSIIDNTGHYISKCIAITYFPFKENDPKEIGEKYFTLVAQNIVSNYINGLKEDKLSSNKKLIIKN